MAIFPPIRQIQTGALRQLLPPALLLVVLLMAPLGCGRTGRLGVQGKVTVNGQPLESGNISFASTAPGGGPSAGAAITNGAYSVPAENGLLPGEYQVQIHSFRRTGKKTWDGMGEPTAAASQKTIVEDLEQYLPAKFNDQTELKAQVTPGKTSGIDFHLELSATGKKK